MAVVDFSNATLTWVGSRSLDEIGLGALWADVNNNIFSAAANSSVAISANETRSRNQISNTHTQIICSGTLTADGTKMVLHNKNIADLYYAYYEISNISFNTGDTFSFIVDIDITS